MRGTASCGPITHARCKGAQLGCKGGPVPFTIDRAASPHRQPGLPVAPSAGTCCARPNCSLPRMASLSGGWGFEVPGRQAVMQVIDWGAGFAASAGCARCVTCTLDVRGGTARRFESGTGPWHGAGMPRLHAPVSTPADAAALDPSAPHPPSSRHGHPGRCSSRGPAPTARPTAASRPPATGPPPNPAPPPPPPPPRRPRSRCCRPGPPASPCPPATSTRMTGTRCSRLRRSWPPGPLGPCTCSAAGSCARTASTTSRWGSPACGGVAWHGVAWGRCGVV